MRALFLTSEGFEDSELFYPYYRLLEEGWDVDVASFDVGPMIGKHGYSFEAGLSFKDIDPKDYELLILPGGSAPERIRLDKCALEVARYFMEMRLPIGCICHGIQTLISADLVRGRAATAYIGIQDDLGMAGANVVDEPVVVDDNLISSRHPGDLPYFMREIMRKWEYD